MSKLYLVLSYFLITPVIIILALIFSLFLLSQADPTHAASFAPQSSTSTYAALPSEDNSSLIQTEITTSDARTEIISQFLQYYRSPLVAYADDIVKAADEYHISYALVPAIAMQESHLCDKIPSDSFNCWGYGIYTNHVTRFKNYQEGIYTVSKTLGTRYRQAGLVTPDQIMKWWTPSSTSWANGVQTFLNLLQ